MQNAYADGRLLAAHDRLMAWASDRYGDLSGHRLIGMSQDDPDVVPLEQCRYDICIIVDEDVTEEADIGWETFDIDCCISVIPL